VWIEGVAGMKRWVVALALMMLVTSQIHAATGEYILRPGDVVSINVFGYPELSYPASGNPESITIRPDGKFAFPFAGEIKAEGISPQQLAQLISELLGKYYVNPRVSVNVARFSTERVYVLGEVNAPGLYELDKSRNLMDALGAAKGWTKDAAKTKVFIIHKNQQGEPLKVNLMELLKKGDVSKNLRLQDGDIVYLTENHRIDMTNDILPLTQIFYNLRSVGVYGGNNNP
jgi:polysaccharide export outer membrane protein